MSERVWSWKGQRPLVGWRSVVDPTIPWLRIDWHVLFLAAVLVGTSLVFVRTMEQADVRFGREDVVSFSAHLKKVVVALPFLFMGFFVRPRWIRRNAWTFYVVGLFLLVLVPLVGEERNNARRWIPLPGIGFERASDWLTVGALALVPMTLVVAQPDLGTAVTIVPVTLGMAWLAGARVEVESVTPLTEYCTGGPAGG